MSAQREGEGTRQQKETTTQHTTACASKAGNYQHGEQAKALSTAFDRDDEICRWPALTVFFGNVGRRRGKGTVEGRNHEHEPCWCMIPAASVQKLNHARACVDAGERWQDLKDRTQRVGYNRTMQTGGCVQMLNSPGPSFSPASPRTSLGRKQRDGLPPKPEPCPADLKRANVK